MLVVSHAELAGAPPQFHGVMGNGLHPASPLHSIFGEIENAFSTGEAWPPFENVFRDLVNELGDTYALSVTDLNPYGWRKGGDAVVAGTGERDDIDLVKPLSDFAQPCEAAILDVADAAGVAEATAGVDVSPTSQALQRLPCLFLMI